MFYCRNNKYDSLFWSFYRNDTCFYNNIIFNYIKAIWVLIFIIILQQFDGWYLGPKILGNQVGLSPIWIIFAITIGGGTFGVMGMFLSVPIVAS
ncbi:AI-2E family transporter [Clostridium botulinum]|nr:AI-2E family transporter [Clostridium botulinum]